MTLIRNGRELTIAEATVRRQTAYTQTYSTAARTVPAAVTDLTQATNISAATASSKLADGTNTVTAANYRTNLKSLNVQIKAINADVLALKKVVTALIDDFQTAGMMQ